MTDYFSKPTGGTKYSIPEKTEARTSANEVTNRNKSNFDVLRKEMQAVASNFKTSKSVVTIKRYGIK